MEDDGLSMSWKPKCCLCNGNRELADWETVALNTDRRMMARGEDATLDEFDKAGFDDFVCIACVEAVSTIACHRYVEGEFVRRLGDDNRKRATSGDMACKDIPDGVG